MPHLTFAPFFVHGHRDPRALPSFPTRRSSDLGHAAADLVEIRGRAIGQHCHDVVGAPIADPGLAIRGNVRRLAARSEEHTSELQSRRDLVCRLLLEKKKNIKSTTAMVHLNRSA